MAQPLVVNRTGEIWSPKGIVAHADSKREMEYLNSLGVDQPITTLTTILPTIIEQKFYEMPLADIVDISVGQGNPFSNVLYNWTSGIEGGDFEQGLINMASNSSNTMSDDIWVEPTERKVIGWKKNVNYNIIQEGTFSQGTQNMDLVQAKYRARKKEYDLGIQKLVNVGLTVNNTDYAGILTQSTATSDSETITKLLSAMTDAEFVTFLSKLIPTFQKNCNYVAFPNRFLIPQNDYVALGSMPIRYTDGAVPFVGATRLQMLENVGKSFTPDFKVVGSAYAMKENNAKVAGLNKNRYVLYNKKPDTIAMDIPLDFTVTLPGTANGFDYTSAAYSRFTGVKAFRPLEVLYFDFA